MPARSKPWRYSDPEQISQTSPLSPILAAYQEHVSVGREREHTLRIHALSPRHLNPLVTPTRWGQRITRDSVFETLFRYQPGAESYEPLLAKHWVVFVGGREMRIVLSAKARFHNGRRVTSVDVQFSVDAARSPRYRAPYLRRQLSAITAVEIRSPRVVHIKMSRNSAYVMRALAAVPILPAQVYQGKLRQKRGLPIVGSGPYRVVERSARQVVLERWQDYWGPLPAIRRVIFDCNPDLADVLIRARAGDYDVVPELKPIYYPAQVEAPSIRRQFNRLLLRPATARFLVANTKRSPLSDRRVRKALSLLVDRNVLASTVYGALATPIGPPIWSGGPGSGFAAVSDVRDEKGAAALLEQAGYQRDSSGVRRKSGYRLELVVLATEKAHLEHKLVLDWFRSAGIASDLRIGPPAVLKNRLRSGNFDLAFVSWSGMVDRDLAPFFSSQGAENYSGLSSAAVDGLLARAAATTRPREREIVLGELAQVLARELPVMGLTAPTPVGLVHKRVKMPAITGPWFRLRELSLSAEAP